MSLRAVSLPSRGRTHDILALHLEPGEATSALTRLLVNMAPENQAGISFLLLQQGTPGPRSDQVVAIWILYCKKLKGYHWNETGPQPPLLCCSKTSKRPALHLPHPCSFNPTSNPPFLEAACSVAGGTEGRHPNNQNKVTDWSATACLAAG